MKHKWLIASILFAIELTLCAGIVFASSTGVSRLQQSGLRWHIFQVETVSAEKDQEQRFTVGSPASLVITNSNGQVTVNSTAGNEIVVHAHLKAWGISPSDAQTTLAALKTDITQTANTVTVKPLAGPEDLVVFGVSHPPTMDLTISVPISTAVDARTSFGSITLSGTGGTVELHATNGPIHVTDVSGNVDLSSSFGGITAERVTGGEFGASSTNGPINLTDIKADGAINLRDSFGAVVFKSGSAVSLDVNSTNGGVTLTNVAVHGAVTARTSFGALSLSQVQAASYDLHSGNGILTVDGASGTLQAQSNFGDIEITNGSQVNLDLHSSNGSIAFSGSLGTGSNTLSTSFGSVRMNLPQDTALTFDFTTNFGHLESEFPVTQSGVVSNKHWAGTINGGGARLTAKTNNGNIDLNILKP